MITTGIDNAQRLVVLLVTTATNTNGHCGGRCGAWLGWHAVIVLEMTWMEVGEVYADP